MSKDCEETKYNTLIIFHFIKNNSVIMLYYYINDSYFK